MVKNVQEIRESQFVLMYGPGALIESKNGSRLIPEINHCLNSKYLEDFLKNNEFGDEVRMSSVIRWLTEENDKSIRLFSMPTDVSQNLKKGSGTFNTYVFPTWKICNENNKGKGSIIYNSMFTENNCCPICHKYSKSNVRFVLACTNGHLDEINWHYAVHGSDNKCNPNHYLWNDKGRNFSDITITCPDCGESTTMDDIYTNVSFKCSGRLPEKQNPYWDSESDVLDKFPAIWDNSKHEKCDNFMNIVQKQSTSLRIPNSIVLLKMPKDDKNIIKIFTKKEFKYLKSPIKRCTNSNELLEIFEDVEKDTLDTIINYMVVNECNNSDNHLFDQNFDNFKQLILDVINGVNLSDALIDEFRTLKSNQPPSNSLIKESFINYNLKWLNNKFPLKIAPISKLKTVTAQLSYIRLPGDIDEETGNPLNNSISSGHKNGNDIWYPAYEGVGEGIFITSDYNPLEYLNIGEDIIYKWNNAVNNIESWGRDEIKNPLFVWWHTLSHALINSLALSCGYNSTSLNERIYIENDRAGILIYNTSPGEDSGMGGLVERAKSFDIVLKNAMDSIIFCSNDPLCYNEEIGKSKVNGAACHNCLLISETSCEHRNSLLDRHMFV